MLYELKIALLLQHFYSVFLGSHKFQEQLMFPI